MRLTPEVKMVLSLLATMLASPPPRSQAGAVTHRYRIEITATSVADLSAMGAPPQTQEQAVVALVAITLADSAGGHRVLVVVDSAHLSAGEVPVPPEMAASARGMTLHGYLDAAGRIQGFRVSTENPVGALLQTSLHEFFPRIRSDAPQGTRWTDTTEVAAATGGGVLQTRMIASFTTGGAERFADTPAIRLTGTFTTSVSGTMQTPGGEAEMTGRGTGSSVYYVAQNWRFLGGTRTATQQSVVKLRATPLEFPVRSTTVMVVTPVP